MSDVERKLADYIDVEVRLDDHPPIGPHMNVESVIDYQGSQAGHQARITNNHVPFDINKS